jgi:hypothetical protein
VNTNMDAILQRLSKVPTFTVYDLLDSGEVVPEYELPTSQVVGELLLLEENLVEQIGVIPAEIMNWGRLVARAKRVWETEERNYRIWRDTLYLNLSQVPDGQKKPTDALLNATIRSTVEYRQWYERIERAEESHNALLAVLEGWRAKKELVRTAVVRQFENAAPQIGV